MFSCTRDRCKVIFNLIWVGYVTAAALACFFLHGVSFFIPLCVGVLLGSIYFAVTGYTFYDLFLKEDGESNRAGLEEVSIGKLLSWLMPALVMVLFVCLGFWISLNPGQNETQTRQGIYFTHAYLLGSIYVMAEELGDNHQLDDEDVIRVINAARGILYHQDLQKRNSVAVGDLLKSRAEYLAMIHKIPFHIAFAFSFLGVLLFTMQDILSRFRTKDLYPKTLIGYQVRFILAISLAIVIAYYFMDNWPANGAPALFLAIGMFPRRALAFLKKKALLYLSLEKEERHSLPLTEIQGMTSYYYERFREINVTDVQNLANSDLLYLRKNMSCGSRLIADFVAQALLILLFPDRIAQLRLLGIRDIINFQAAVTGNDTALTTALGRSNSELQNLLGADGIKERIDSLVKLKNKSDKEEQVLIVNW